MTLNGLEFDVVVSRIMFKTDVTLALKWLKTQNHKMSKQTYYNHLNRLDADAQSRLYELAQKFSIIAADEIVKFQGIEKQMYEEYHKEKLPINRARILKMIAELQPYITSLYDQTRTIMEGKIATAVKEDPILSFNTE